MAKTYYLGALKVTDKKQFDRDEIVVEMLDHLQKLVPIADEAAHDPDRTLEERLDAVSNVQTRFAALANFMVNDLGIEIRSDDGFLVTSSLFNRIFYFQTMLKVEIGRQEDLKKEGDHREDVVVPEP